MPGRKYASSITFLSMSTQICSRAAVSVGRERLVQQRVDGGVLTDRLELPPVARMTRLSTIWRRKP
jgi:hypothetical protein